MKYIVKNCPAFTPQAYEHCCSLDGNYKCEYCTDCVIKQVIENCKEVENIENVETLYDAAQSGMFLQANRILKLLDIAEIKE